MAELVNPVFRALDPVTGVPLPGACLYTLSPGTSWPSGAKSAYYDILMATPASNPIIANGDGDFIGAGNGIFLDGSYQLVLTSADGTTAAYGSQVFWSISNWQGIGTQGQFASVSSYTSLTAAVAAIGNTPTTLLIGTPQTLISNLTIPSTLSLLFVQGGSIALAGFSLTIDSYFQRPGPIEVFSGTGTVVFGAGCLDFTADPAWFGGGSAGASAANTSAVNVIATLSAGNATPDVSSLGGIDGSFKTNNSNATTITNFTNMVAGQKFDIIVEDAYTSFGGTIRGLPPSTPQYTALSFISDGTYAYCVGPPQGVTAAYRNRFINGEMRIDQRHVGTIYNKAGNVAAANAYTVDRWFMIPQGANITGQQVSGPAGSQWENMLQINGASFIESVLLAQRIESINILDLGNSNSVVSLSAYIATTAANANIAWSAQTPTAQDNYTAVANVANGIWSANANLTRYTANFKLNSNASYGLQVGFTVANMSSGVFQITGAQLEAGATVTPFERRPDDVETIRCMRYCQGVRTIAANAMLMLPGIAVANNQAAIHLPLPVPMTPNCNSSNFSLLSSNVGDFWVQSASGNTTLQANALTWNNTLTGTATIYANVANGLTSGAGVFLLNANGVPSTIDYIYIVGEL